MQPLKKYIQKRKKKIFFSIVDNGEKGKGSETSELKRIHV